MVYNDYLFSETMMNVMQKAAYIAAALKDSTIHSAHIIWAILSDENDFSDYMVYEKNLYFSLNILSDEIKDKNSTLLTEVFGEKHAKDITANLFSCMTVDSLEKLIETVKSENNYSKEKNEEVPLFFFDASLKNAIDIEFSENVESALVESQLRCSVATNHIIDLMNFTYSLLCIDNSSAVNALELMGIDTTELLSELEENFAIYDPYSSNNCNFSLPPSMAQFCDVVNLKYNKDIKCDILGRDEEIKKFWIISSRKTKKNSILVGPAGCGKTAIVEAITMSIVNGTCPKAFRNYTVLELNLSSMLADTQYRGDFEGKVTELIDTLKNNHKLILFIDEIHQVLGAGSTEGSAIDLAGMLKPILARDDTIVIGATTKDEYNKYMYKDSAFKRRFEVISVKEPKISELKPMIKARVKNLSEYHKVAITEEVLDYIIIQAYAFTPETSNPDKTISLCDSSMAVAKNKKKNRHELTKADVDAVNMDKIKRFKAYSKEGRKRIAYHEAGHYVLSRILKSLRVEIPISLSIVATDDYLGAYSYENDDTIDVCADAIFHKERMMALLAGRASEQYFFNNVNAGAVSDLQKVMTYAQSMILESGMDKNNFFNMALINYDMDNFNLITDENKALILKKIKEIVDEAYEDTLNLIKKYHELIKDIGDELIIKGMMASTEVDEIFKKHGVKIKKSATLTSCNEIASYNPNNK